MSKDRKILVFDSGIGGLSVLAELRRTLAGALFVYVADDAAFPYGDWEEGRLHDHVVALVGRLIGDFAPDLLVLACNTASTLVLPELRRRHALPFVGTVPAIKPAAELTQSGLISVLATPGTMARDHTRSLIGSFASACEVRLVGCSSLATLAEAHMRGEVLDEEVVWGEIAPAFVEKEGRRTDTVVLACTHYPFLLPIFMRLAPWSVRWIDPAPAIARRAAELVQGADGEAQAGEAWLTSGRGWEPSLVALLASFDLRAMARPAKTADTGAK